MADEEALTGGAPLHPAPLPVPIVPVVSMDEYAVTPTSTARPAPGLPEPSSAWIWAAKEDICAGAHAGVDVAAVVLTLEPIVPQRVGWDRDEKLANAACRSVDERSMSVHVPHASTRAPRLETMLEERREAVVLVGSAMWLVLATATTRKLPVTDPAGAVDAAPAVAVLMACSRAAAPMQGPPAAMNAFKSPAPSTSQAVVSTPATMEALALALPVAEEGPVQPPAWDSGEGEAGPVPAGAAAVPEGETVAAVDADAVGLGLAALEADTDACMDWEGLWEGEPVAEAEDEGVASSDGLAEGEEDGRAGFCDWDGVTERPVVTEGVTEGVTDASAVADAVADALPVADWEEEGLLLTLTVAATVEVTDGESDGDAVTVAATDWEAVGEGEPLGEAVTVADTLGDTEGLVVAEALPLGLWLLLTVTAGVTEGLTDGLGPMDCVLLGLRPLVGLTLLVGLVEGVKEGLLDPLAVREEETDVEGVTLAVTLGETVTEPVTVPVMVMDGLTLPLAVLDGLKLAVKL